MKISIFNLLYSFQIDMQTSSSSRSTDSGVYTATRQRSLKVGKTIRSSHSTIHHRDFVLGNDTGHIAITNSQRSGKGGLKRRVFVKTSVLRHASTNSGSIVSGSNSRVSQSRGKQRDDHNPENQNFHCNYCPKSFGQLGNLRDHIYIHTGERPRICDVCNRTFIQLSHLNRHKVSHVSEERPYICGGCKKEYVSPQDVRDHLKTKCRQRKANSFKERSPTDSSNSNNEGKLKFRFTKRNTKMIKWVLQQIRIIKVRLSPIVEVR